MRIATNRFPKAPSSRPSTRSAPSETVPGERSITIRHLLTPTSGLVYQWNPTLGERYADRGITHGLVGDTNTLAEDMIGISVAQKHPGGGATLNGTFRILAHQAIVE